MRVSSILPSKLDEETKLLSRRGSKEQESKIVEALVVCERNLFASLVVVVVWVWKIYAIGGRWVPGLDGEWVSILFAEF